MILYQGLEGWLFMNLLLKGAKICDTKAVYKSDILIKNGLITDFGSIDLINPDIKVISLENYTVFPGFVDVHVHLREPGFFYKETIDTGTKAALKGGFTTVCAMPNLNPVPDSYENLYIPKDAHVNVIPYGSITKGQQGKELSNFEELAPYIAGFSDDGRGVQDEDLMLRAMKKAKQLNKIIAAHCEDDTLLNGGYIHDGIYAKKHNHKGITSESEWRQLERDIRLIKKTGVSYHVCHISTKESVNLIRKAKKEGLDITAETAPHYLILCDEDIEDHGRFKMNPPIRAKEDREALIAGLLDGTIDMIATDHAPHTHEEKSKGLEKSLFGVVGLETAFPVMYTYFVKTGLCNLQTLISWFHTNPIKRFSINQSFEIGSPANLCVFNLEKSYKINPDTFSSKGKSTPFEGMLVYGEHIMTILN